MTEDAAGAIDGPSASPGAGEEPAVLMLAGELEDADEVRAAIAAANGTFTRPLRVDLSAVTYLPSVILGVLFGAINTATRAGTTVEIAAKAGSVVEHILTVTAMPHTVL